MIKVRVSSLQIEERHLKKLLRCPQQLGKKSKRNIKCIDRNWRATNNPKFQTS